MLFRGSPNTATRTWEARAARWLRLMEPRRLWSGRLPGIQQPVPRHSPRQAYGLFFWGGGAGVETLVGHAFEPLIPNGLGILRPAWNVDPFIPLSLA